MRRPHGPGKAQKPYGLAPGIESLEDRTQLTVTAILNSTLLDISLSASGDSAAVVVGAIDRSTVHRLLARQHRAPKVSVRKALAAALKAEKQVPIVTTGADTPRLLEFRARASRRGEFPVAA
jgi:hypothetical protein